MFISMYKLTNSVLETIKTFCMSILCSVIFSLMIYRETVYFIKVVCFVLNLASFILFLLFYYRNWYRVYMKSFSPGDYWVPAVTSFTVFCGISCYLYIIKAGSIYRWFFQQTRFLEPMLNAQYTFLSFIVSQLLIFAVLVAVPIIHADKN